MHFWANMTIQQTHCFGCTQFEDINILKLQASSYF